MSLITTNDNLSPCSICTQYHFNTVECLLRPDPTERPTPLKRPNDNIDHNINALISNRKVRPHNRHNKGGLKRGVPMYNKQ